MTTSISWLRIEERVRKELAGLIFDRKRKDDDLGFVSIIQLKLAKDYGTLKVWVSLFGDEEDQKRTWNALIRHHHHFQGTVSRNLHLRSTPKIIFVKDTRTREGDRVIEKILDS